MKFLLKWLFNPDWFTFHFGGGGGGGTTTGTTYNTNIPEYAEPYVMNMLGATQRQLFNINENNEITGFKPYKPYSSSAEDYVAGFSPMQEQAMRTAASPEAFGQQVQGYMSPYMQNVVDIQKREAMRGAGIVGAQQQAQATNAGAFGGYREGIQRAENTRNLGMQMNDIQLKGQQMAFDNAQQQARVSQGQQMQYGGMQQAQEQQKINQRIQDFANAQQYPIMQLGTMSNMLRGLPMQAQTTNQYVAAPNPITQGIGLAGAGASLYNATRPAGGAAGGLPSEFKYASGGIASVPRYDVGGEVESDLESMKTEELSKRARESSSPIIRRMAQRILRERQMEQGPDKGAMPTGPMGVDYQAPQMAAGGIVAFQDGGLNDLQRRLAAATQSGDFESASLYAKQVADAQAPVKSSKIEWPNKPGVDIQRKDGAAPPARSGITQMSPEAIERLRQNPYAESKPAPRMPDESQMGGSLATSVAPRPAPAPTRAAAPAAPRAPAPAPVAEPDGSAGIMAAANSEDRAGEADAQKALAAGVKPVEAAPVFTGPFAEIRKALYEANKEAGMSDEEALRRVREGKPENTAAAEYRKQVMAERANSKEENERQRYMRAAQFFAKWGSTPGPTIAAGLSALEKSLPDMIADEASFKKAKRELDKIVFDIDNATRLEELGDRKEARALKERAADRAFQLNERLAQAMSSENVARINKEGTIEAANIRAQSEKAGRAESAAQRRQAADTAAEAKTYGQYQAAGRQRDVVERDIAREKEGKQHITDLKFLQTYENMDLKDLPKGYDKKIKEVRQRVTTTEQGWETRLNRAKLSEENAYKRYMGENAGPTTTAPPPAAGKTVTMDDVIATAKASGKPIEQVRKDAIAKGFTVK